MTRKLAGDGLATNLTLAQMAGEMAARLLDEVRVPGVPRPEDDDWSF